MSAPGSDPSRPPQGGPTSPVRVALDVSAVPDNPAGAGRYVLDLTRRLSARDDVDLVLISRKDDETRWRSVAADARVESLAPSARPLRLAWEQSLAPGLLDRLGPDVYHGPHYTLPYRSRLPKVVTVHDLTFFDHPEWHERAKVLFFRQAIRLAVERADAIVCVSEHTAERLRELLSPGARVVVVPHGVDRELFHPADPEESSSDLRRLAALGVSPPYVAFLGTVEPRKDVPTLVRAFDRMASSHPGLRLVIAGAAGWGEQDLRTAMSQARRSDRILRLGYVPEDATAPLLRAAAVVAYPSLAEGFGLPVLEALACGTPVVTTAGTPMARTAGGAALLVAPHDPRALAGALDMAVRGDASQAARRRAGLIVASAHSWDRSAAMHVALYRDLLSLSAAPGRSRSFSSKGGRIQRWLAQGGLSRGRGGEGPSGLARLRRGRPS